MVEGETNPKLTAAREFFEELRGIGELARNEGQALLDRSQQADGAWSGPYARTQTHHAYLLDVNALSSFTSIDVLVAPFVANPSVLR